MRTVLRRELRTQLQACAWSRSSCRHGAAAQRQQLHACQLPPGPRRTAQGRLPNLPAARHEVVGACLVRCHLVQGGMQLQGLLAAGPHLKGQLLHKTIMSLGRVVGWIYEKAYGQGRRWAEPEHDPGGADTAVARPWRQRRKARRHDAAPPRRPWAWQMTQTALARQGDPHPAVATVLARLPRTLFRTQHLQARHQACSFRKATNLFPLCGLIWPCSSTAGICTQPAKAAGLAVAGPGAAELTDNVEQRLGRGSGRRRGSVGKGSLRGRRGLYEASGGRMHLGRVRVDKNEIDYLVGIIQRRTGLRVRGWEGCQDAPLHIAPANARICCARSCLQVSTGRGITLTEIRPACMLRH